MEIYKNLDSEGYFIYLDDVSSEKILLVTPDAEIKALGKSLFMEVPFKDEKDLIDRGMITEQQVNKYHLYWENRRNEPLELLEFLMEEMSLVELEDYKERLHGRMKSDKKEV